MPCLQRGSFAVPWVLCWGLKGSPACRCPKQGEALGSGCFIATAQILGCPRD